MALDIRQGDVLVVGSAEYAIRKVNPWSDPLTPIASMRMICNLDGSLKRPPTLDGVASRQRGIPVAIPGTFKISPVDPPSQTTLQTFLRAGNNSPINLKECFADGGDTFYQVVLEEDLR